MKTVKNILWLGILIVTLGAFLNSCSEESMDPNDPQNPGDPCDNVINLEVDNLVHSYTDQSTGRFDINVSGGNGDVELAINGGDFSASNSFKDLQAGTYTIEAVDDSSCTASINVEVMEFPERSFANDVQPIIETNCRVSGCHGDRAGIPSWENYEIISSRAQRIKERTSEGSMPPASSGQSLTDAEITIIQNWVDTGAPNN